MKTPICITFCDNCRWVRPVKKIELAIEDNIINRSGTPKQFAEIYKIVVRTRR